MTTTQRTPTVDELREVLVALASWQQDGAPVQLHPGDLGWQWRLGAGAVADSLRVWRRGGDDGDDGEVVAVGFVDLDVTPGEPTVVRMGVSPEVGDDQDVARALARDLEDPSAGVLPPGPAAVEARSGVALQARLRADGWVLDEPWTPLQRDLADPVADAPRVEVVDAALAAERVAVHRAAFTTSTFTEERWRLMTAGPAYRDARCLLLRDHAGTAVAAVTVWSAGAGRPGLVEPMGVHRDHRGAGHGTAVTLAGAAALRDLGASTVTVATPASNTAGVATYVAAGFTAAPDVTDLRRPG